MSKTIQKAARVLIVDDDPDVSTHVDIRARGSRHHYISVSTTKNALNELNPKKSTQSFDLVIVDFELEGGETAVDFIDQAKNVRPEVPYVIWSKHSEGEIRKKLNLVPLELLFNIDIKGFTEKFKTLSAPDGLDSFVDNRLARFEAQITRQLSTAFLQHYNELERALTHIDTVATKLGSSGNSSATKFSGFSSATTAFHLRRAENILRSALGYRDHPCNLSANDFRQALYECTSRTTRRRLPLPVGRVIRTIAYDKKRTFSHDLHAALMAIGDNEADQRLVARAMSEIVDLLIETGSERKAAQVSRNLWEVANGTWAFSPRITSALCHTSALISNGQSDLAEQLTAAVIHEAEKTLSGSKLRELSRTVFAELKHRKSNYRGLSTHVPHR